MDSRRGNCHDNAVAESFFQLLKRERIRRKVYLTRDEGKADVFDYIEMFYNPKRRYSSSGRLSPVDYESNQARASLPAITGNYKKFDHSKSPEIIRFYCGIPAKFRQKTIS